MLLLFYNTIKVRWLPESRPWLTLPWFTLWLPSHSLHSPEKFGRRNSSSWENGVRNFEIFTDVDARSLWKINQFVLSKILENPNNYYASNTFSNEAWSYLTFLVLLTPCTFFYGPEYVFWKICDGNTGLKAWLKSSDFLYNTYNHELGVWFRLIY